MFKKIIFSFTLIMLMVNILSAQEDIDTNRIYWTDSYKLTWSDFLADEEEGETIAAQSSIGLPYKFVSDREGEMVVTIQVCFIRDESWSREEKQNDVLLKHEQLHFDIAELHRRMIVKALEEATFTKENHKELLDEIVKKIWLVKYREMQDEYDQETNFSRIIRQQYNWQKDIRKQLADYKEYDKSELTISLIN